MATERIDIVINETGGKRVVNVIINIHQAADRAEKSISIFRRGMGLLGSAVSGAVAALRRLISNLFSVRTLITTIISGYALKQVIDYADSWQTASNKLAAFIDDADKVIVVQEELFAISRRSRSEFAATMTVYSRLLLSQDSLGISTKELLEVTETLNKAVILSGASSSEASAGLIQLSQGIASGALRGDELRSVLEQLPFVAQLLADHLKVTRGELRTLGTEGKITADIIVAALQGAADVVDERFGRTVPTLGQSFVVLRNSLERFIGKLAQATGILKSMSSAVLGLATMLDNLVEIFGAMNTKVSDGPLRAFAGREAAALLVEGSTVGKVLVSLTKELLFTDLVPALGRIMANAAIVLVTSILELLIRFTPQILTIVYVFAEALVSAIITTLRQAAPEIAATIGLRASGDSTESIQSTLAGAVSTIRTGASSAIVADLDLATENIKVYAEGVSYLAGVVREARGELDLLGDAANKDNVILDPKSAGELDAVLNGLRQEIDLTRDLSRSVGENKTIFDGTALAIAAFGENTEMANQKIAELDRLVDQLAHTQAIRKSAGELDAVLNGLRQEIDLTRDLSRSVGENKTIFDGTALAIAAFGENTEMANQKIAELNRLVDQLAHTQAIRKLAEDIGRAFADSFEGAIFEAKSFRDVVESLVKDISRLVFQELVSKQIAGGIAALLGGTGGAGGFGGLLKAFGFAGGGIVDQPTFMGFSGGRPVVAGEGNRPEAVVPLGDGNTLPVVIKNGGSGGSGGNTYSVSVNVHGVQDPRGMERSARQAGEQIVRTLRRYDR